MGEKIKLFLNWLIDEQLEFIHIRGKGWFKTDGSELHKFYTVDELFAYWQIKVV